MKKNGGFTKQRRKENERSQATESVLSYERSQITVRVGGDEICLDKRLSLRRLQREQNT